MADQPALQIDDLLQKAGIQVGTRLRGKAPLGGGETVFVVKAILPAGRYITINTSELFGTSAFPIAPRRRRLVLEYKTIGGNTGTHAAETPKRPRHLLTKFIGNTYRVVAVSEAKPA